MTNQNKHHFLVLQTSRNNKWQRNMNSVVYNIQLSSYTIIPIVHNNNDIPNICLVFS